MHSNPVVGFTDEQSARLGALRDDVAEFDRMIAAAEVGRMRLLAKASDLVNEMVAETPLRVRQSDMVLRSIAAEIAVATHVSDRSMQRQIGEAAALVSFYPATSRRASRARSRAATCARCRRPERSCRLKTVRRSMSLPQSSAPKTLRHE